MFTLNVRFNFIFIIYATTIFTIKYYNIGKSILDRDSRNVEHLEQLEKNVLTAKIRNIFDIEFNKNYQGSLQLPPPSSGRTHTSTNANKYLFFITDKFVDEDKI